MTTATTPSLVVFDLGGTTVRDGGEVPAAFKAALEADGSVLSADAIERWRGASKLEAIRQIVTDGNPEMPERQLARRVHAIYRVFRGELMRRFLGASDLALPGAQPTFERLHAAGISLAINTGFDREVTDAVLEATGWPPDLFDAVVTAEDVDEGRPSPDMILLSMECVGLRDAGRVAVVGDTRLDLEAGFNAGAEWCVGVLTGADDRATLEQAPYTHIVESVAQVPGLWL
jgi:phosphonatase-like hydrolase